MNRIRRFNLQLSPVTDKMLREIALVTKLKLVTIISNGIESEYRRLKKP